jgi:S1-C subfamily serine protease
MSQNPTGPNKLRTRLNQYLRRLKSALPFVYGVSSALLALLLFNFLFPKTEPMTVQEVNDAVAVALASATPPPAYSAQVFNIIQPSLVLIKTKNRGKTNQASEDGLGSGVVIDLTGRILTSLHVVADASEIEITYPNGSRSPAEIASYQPEKDIAVLTPLNPPPQVFPAILGNPDSMHVGDDAFVVGNPFGLYGSMSAGVISGFNRQFQPPGNGQTIDGLIQIDAAVNPGNSGGPLLNRSGHVIGIVTGIVNPTEENFFIGIGFAVPINVAVAGAGGPAY